MPSLRAEAGDANVAMLDDKFHHSSAKAEALMARLREARDRRQHQGAWADAPSPHARAQHQTNPQEANTIRMSPKQDVDNMFRITVLAPPQDGLGEVRPRLSSRPTGRSTVMGTQSQRRPPGTGSSDPSGEPPAKVAVDDVARVIVPAAAALAHARRAQEPNSAHSQGSHPASGRRASSAQSQSQPDAAALGRARGGVKAGGQEVRVLPRKTPSTRARGPDAAGAGDGTRDTRGARPRAHEAAGTREEHKARSGETGSVRRSSSRCGSAVAPGGAGSGSREEEVKAARRVTRVEGDPVPTSAGTKSARRGSGPKPGRVASESGMRTRSSSAHFAANVEPEEAGAPARKAVQKKLTSMKKPKPNNPTTISAPARERSRFRSASALHSKPEAVARPVTPHEHVNVLMNKLRPNDRNQLLSEIKDTYAIAGRPCPWGDRDSAVPQSEPGLTRNKMDMDKERKVKELLSSVDFNGEGSLEFYKMGQLLGQGAFSKVFAAWHRLTGHKVAIKQYSLSRLERDAALLQSVKREVQLYKKLSHPGVAHLYESFSNRMFLCLVLEYLPNGTLVSQLRKQKLLSTNNQPRMAESMAQSVVLPIAQGLAHMHERSIMHRDIKLENVMLGEDDKPKLVDLGFGSFCRSHAVMDNQLENGGTAQKGLTQVFGTPLYMAPEVWEKSYGKSADIWSLGCVMYILITGQYPFWGDAEQDLKWISKKGNYWVPDHLSADSRDLLQKMLCVDATERATAEQVVNHPWFRPVKGRAKDAFSDSMYCASKDMGDNELIKQMDDMGFDTMLVKQALDTDIRNQFSTTYKMLAQKKIANNDAAIA